MMTPTNIFPFSGSREMLPLQTTLQKKLSLTSYHHHQMKA
uniref:Uncharacterized protein n=1 Tax=Rhizophora mucronata TaxID=61149 RepID=A0A2P2PZM7_RHIMU